MTSHLERKIFFDGSPGIARYETNKYPWISKLVDKQLSFFWRPQEIDLNQDDKDWKNLSDHEQHIFTSNLKRQILLDTIQGRNPSLAFLPIVSIPEMETWIQTWAFSETIHSQSYTHIIRNIYSDPSAVFDGIMDIPEIVACSDVIGKYYDSLIVANNNLQAQYRHYLSGEPKLYVNWDMSLYNWKKALWLTLVSVNILEGIRFYASFACSWAFAENKRMEGNAKIIKLICRDENLHLAGTQQLLKTLLKDDPDYVKIREKTYDECTQMFVDTAEQEKAWAKYLFANGSMIGLNQQLLCDYIDYITEKRAAAIGYGTTSAFKQNPLPWTQKWIAGSDVQVAPQEVELSSYTIGAINKDVTTDTFKGIKL